MGTADSINPDASLWHWLAFDLRRYRQARKQSVTEVGRIMGVARTSVSNFEAMRRRPDVDHLKRLDATWRTGGHFLRLLTFARLNHDPNWFKEHLFYEARAYMLRVFEPLVIPGLLQTEDYARTVLMAEDAEDIAADLQVRFARQEILNRKNPPRVHVLLDEGVIDRQVGGPGIMRDQLAHLLTISEPGGPVTLRVVPRSAGYHRGLMGAFKIMTCDPEGDIAYTEAAEGGRLVLDGAGVKRFVVRFDEIGADALSRSASRELIKRVMEEIG
ncbi:helix-turn-helix domain-containing protein [Actinoallomurus rhizosphaericola]|uniref:helix-turn-helix domain-containing protein n=1 Tax=Actinoallomurus rhizosphaericola TaxID=2952536 RepID=UPI0020928520|nr:helix-turn-helix transcriptional regulator [Actinoallomurus rhizosphaericola]MCO5999523.1 helix-turn-helix transcriptional regulator [Actinoallomurus rhizosphaericola]